MRKLKTLFALLVLSFFTIGNLWATPVQIYKNEGTTSGQPTGITVTGNVNTNSSNGNPGNSFANTSSSNTTFTFSGFDLSDYTNLELHIDAKYGQFPSTTNTWPYVTVTFYKGENAVKTDNTTLKWTSKVYTYTTYTIDNVPDFDRIVIVGSPAIGKTSGGSASTTYSLYMDNITILGEENVGPTMSVEKAGSPITSLNFGNVKQHTIGPNDNEYVKETITLVGANLSSNVAVSAYGAMFQVYDVSDIAPSSGSINQDIEVWAATGADAGTYNPEDYYLTISSKANPKEFTDITIGLSMTLTPTYEVAVAVNNNTMGSATVNGSASVYVDEDDDLSLVATPNSGYEFVNWTFSVPANIVKNDGDENKASVTIQSTGAVTITANFQAQSCTNLAAPTLDAVTKTYNSATIAWNTVTNAEGYVLNITKHLDGSAVLTNEIIVAPAVSFEKTELSANTQYDYTVMAIGDGSTYCDENNPLLEGSFTTNDYPAATLSFVENNSEPYNLAGDHKLLDVVTLPSALNNEANMVAGKVFRGWDANASCTSAPTYAPGAEYTLTAESQTLYAVFATQTGDAEPVLAQTLQYDTWTYSGTTINKSSYRLFQSGSYITSTSFDLSKLTKVIVYGGTYGGGTYNSLTIGDGTNTWKNVTVSGTSATGENIYTEGNALTGTGTLQIKSNSGSGTGNSATGVRISRIEIYTQTPVSYSDFVTTGKKAPKVTLATDARTINKNGVASGSVTVTYLNVDLDHVKVATYSNEACTDTLDGGWLVAGLNGSKNITYSAEAAVDYKNSRVAYILLTAPAAEDGVTAVTAKFTATQNEKDPVFDSFEDLVAVEFETSKQVTVSFSNVKIVGFTVSNQNVEIDKKGDVENANIHLYHASVAAPNTWAADGYISGTITGYWGTYNNARQLTVTTWEGINYSSEKTGFDNIENSEKAVKVLRNGILYIEKAGKTYNAMGQLVK